MGPNEIALVIAWTHQPIIKVIAPKAFETKSRTDTQTATIRETKAHEVTAC